MAEGVRVKADGFQVDKWMKQLGDRPLYKESRGGGAVPRDPTPPDQQLIFLKAHPPHTKQRKEKKRVKQIVLAL